MNRRGFLRGVASALAVIAVPSVLSSGVASWKAIQTTAGSFTFDPAQEYGDYVMYCSEEGPELISPVTQFILNSARGYLPPGTPFALIHRPPMPAASDPFAQCGTMGWKYTPSNKKGPYFA